MRLALAALFFGEPIICIVLSVTTVLGAVIAVLLHTALFLVSIGSVLLLLSFYLLVRCLAGRLPAHKFLQPDQAPCRKI